MTTWRIEEVDRDGAGTMVVVWNEAMNGGLRVSHPLPVNEQTGKIKTGAALTAYMVSIVPHTELNNRSNQRDKVAGTSALAVAALVGQNGTI